MDANDFVMENCRATWREEARKRTADEAKAAGLDPEDSSEAVRRFIESRTAAIYAELERIGLENIR